MRKAFDANVPKLRPRLRSAMEEAAGGEPVAEAPLPEPLAEGGDEEISAAPTSTPAAAPSAHSLATRAAGGLRRQDGGSAPGTPKTATAAAVRTVVADPDLAALALAEVRMALRGRTVEELASALGQDRASVEGALRALVCEGKLAVRGPRFFVS
jgi:hypothetical protein